MVRFKNFECTINVGGPSHPLPEYTDPNDAGDREGPVPTAIVYVQSEEGKAFSIRLDVVDDVGLFVQGANRISIGLALDGTTLPKAWTVRPRDYITLDGCKYHDTRGQYVQGQFLFSKLDVLEESRGPEKSGDANSLGEITMNLYRWKKTAEEPRSYQKRMDEHLLNIKSVTEKRLKGRDITQSVRWALTISPPFPHIITFDLQIICPKTRSTESNCCSRSLH
jgi:hypothetical protein